MADQNYPPPAYQQSVYQEQPQQGYPAPQQQQQPMMGQPVQGGAPPQQYMDDTSPPQKSEGCFACCCCLDGGGDGINGDEVKGNYGRYLQRRNFFATNMGNAPFEAPAWFCYALCCPVCSQFQLRQKVLDGDLSQYKCCQGYFDCCCFKAGCLNEQDCPAFCLCLEACCCHNLAVSASRLYVMDRFDLRVDPCDIRIIRCNNCLQCVACIFSIIAIFVRELREAAYWVRRLADLVYCCTQACMTAQTNFEMEKAMLDGRVQAPQKQLMQ